MADPSVEFAHALSRLLGWIYTLAWSVSFYPQGLLNWRRRSTKGAVIDYPLINVLGFFFYTLSTVLLFANPTVRAQYAARNPKSPEPLVQPNDVAFTTHALLITIITLSQWWGWLWGFKQKRNQRPKRYIVGVALGCVVGTFWVLFLAAGDDGYNPDGWAWIDVVYAMGYCKLAISVIKYCPQVWDNYKRKSTVGWSIWQVLLDFVGGVLSITQLIMDSSLQNDWSGVTGNPAKFWLGNVSIVFDTIFMIQHYVLYRNAGGSEGEQRGLLAHSSEHE